jgi:hypothetical protein
MAVLRKEMDELKRPKQDDTEGDDGDPEKAALNASYKKNGLSEKQLTK